MGWAGTEFEAIDLADARQNKRVIRLLKRLSAQPTASVPQTCGAGPAELQSTAQHVRTTQLCRFNFARNAGRAQCMAVGTRA